MEVLYLETDKQKLEKLENLYEMVMDFEKKSHEKNQKRIRIGLRCLYIIPAIFLFLLVVMKSSKIIFLALWIISLFILAVYLIVVEYMDYNLQNHINKLEGKKNGKEQQYTVFPFPEDLGNCLPVPGPEKAGEKKWVHKQVLVGIGEQGDESSSQRQIDSPLKRSFSCFTGNANRQTAGQNTPQKPQGVFPALHQCSIEQRKLLAVG